MQNELISNKGMDRAEKLRALKERAQLAGRVDSGCSAEPDHSVESEDRQCVFAGQFVGGKVVGR
jgi:hypothetical protein